jgi:hypothetical protein
MDCKTKQPIFSNTIMTKCNKGGVKIRNTDNDYKSNPFSKLNNSIPEKNLPINDNGCLLYEKLDLNIENYNRKDIFKLFSIKTNTLTEEIMKDCKKIVLKMHPDKSRLEQKYFFFFSAAYKKLFNIYEFQQKSSRDIQEEYNTNDDMILDTIFSGETNMNKDPKKFNEWFNEQFKKNQLEDPLETGYGNWLKSDEDIVFIPHVTKSNMAAEIEKRKKHVQTLTAYTGVGEQFAPVFAGSTLIEYNDNFTSGGIFSNEGMGYTDLRQAYIESVIPVTEEDYHKMPKFSSVDEYKRFREKGLQ